MRSLALSTLLVLTAGCVHAAPAAVTPEPPPAAALAPSEAAPPRDPTPLSIKRLLAEQRAEIDDVLALTVPLTDLRGRARAQREADELSAELVTIGESLAVEAASSERYDQAALRLLRLATRVSLLHEALRGAVSDKTALQTD